MIKVIPISIICERDGLFVACCHADKVLLSFKFNVEVETLDGQQFRSLNHEDDFYKATYDDPAAAWLEESIKLFDSARQESQMQNQSKLFPKQIKVIDPATGQYEIILQGPDDCQAYEVKVIQTADKRRAVWQFGQSESRLKSSGFWVTTPDSQTILNAVLMLHQALVPVYRLPADQAVQPS